jgi:hypothetical protein
MKNPPILQWAACGIVRPNSSQAMVEDLDVNPCEIARTRPLIGKPPGSASTYGHIPSKIHGISQIIKQ